MGTGIYLQSDFVEKYDQYLHDPNGKIVWKRLSKGGMSRRDMLSFLDDNKNKYHFSVVPHGRVKELDDKYNPEKDGTWKDSGIYSYYHKMVVYLDESLHRGEGKILLDVEDAVKIYPDKYASIYLRNDNDIFPTHERHLYIGNKCYVLTYISITDKWRSNCGRVFIKLKYILDNIPNNKLLSYPIYAVDILRILCEAVDNVVPIYLEPFVVDFNIAPGIPITIFKEGYNNPMSFYDIISPEEIATLIAERVKNEL
jgi:hypothetical protein